MKFSECILMDCEEFFELIDNEADNSKLDQAMDSLRNLLEEDIDGWSDDSEEGLARAAQCRLMEIWGLIPKTEKSMNPDLREYYDNLVNRLENVSGYETDEEEANYEEEVEQ